MKEVQQQLEKEAKSRKSSENGLTPMGVESVSGAKGYELEGRDREVKV